MPCAAQTSAISATGSMLVDDVVPTVATAAIGRRPARTSAATASRSASVRIRNAASDGIFTRPSCPKPSTMQAFSTDECASSDV